MSATELPWDIPAPFAKMAVTARKLQGTLAIYDSADRLIFANAGVRRLYPWFDLSVPQTFESMLRRSWEHGEMVGIPAPRDPEAQLAYANMRRQGERLEFIRRYPTNLICTHLRLSSGMNAQLRLEPKKAGLLHFFSEDEPTLGVMEAIHQRDEAAHRAAALDCLAFGIATLGPDRKVIQRNAAMAEMIANADGVFLDAADRLTPVHAEECAEFNRLVTLACMNKLEAPTVAMHLRSPDSPHPHTFSISHGARGSKTAVIIVAPARLDVGSVSSVLRRDFGLTPAESTLAAQIGNGLTNDDIARESGKAPNTGRMQVKSILRKLDDGQLAHRSQTGLARWVAVLAAITGAARTRGKS
ncbi:helix-turn-helix transcriptional regulator [Azospirillum argentinense]